MDRVLEPLFFLKAVHLDANGVITQSHGKKAHNSYIEAINVRAAINA